MDPLAVIFHPGGIIFGVLALGAPFAVLGFRWWRSRALRRVAAGCCGNCGASFDWSGERYLVAGMDICGRCAHTMRRTLRVLLPTIGVAAVGFSISSGTAFATSMLTGGPELAWWLDGRWIPLLTPSVGVAALTWWLVRQGKRANQEAEQMSSVAHREAETLPFPSAVVGLTRARSRAASDEPR